MTDKTEFSIDFNINPKSGFEPLPDWVAFDLCRAYPIEDGKLLLHNTNNGKRAVVMPEVHAALASCRQFKTLDQHTAHIIDRNPGMQGQQADIRQVLQKMLDSGIMISAKAIGDDLKLKPPGQEKEIIDKPVVAIITWERPESLERLLDSIVTNCNSKDVLRLYVIDDSRKAECIEQNRMLVDRFSSQLETPLLYFGQEEQQSLLAKLASSLPQHEESIRFLADQSRWRDYWTSGLARNIALLVSCGHRLVMMDDDTLCDVYHPRELKPNISYSDEPREADFFASEQEWGALHEPTNPDPIARHMQYLGLSFSAALKKLGPQHLKPSGFANATAMMTSELQPDSAVLVTECGSLGCPGTGNNTWLPEMAPGSLRRLLASKEKTKLSLSSRLVWSGRNQPHFAPRSNMSPITGFDNRQMLPPYLPITRGEDRLFGYMVDFIFPNAIALDYPWAVPHLPLPKRKWRNEDNDFTPGHSFPRFFFEKVVDQKSFCLADSPNERIAALSAWLADLAGAPDKTLVSMYRDSRLHRSSNQAKHLSELLKNSESAASEWQSYLKNGIDQLTADLDKTSLEDLPIKGTPLSMEGGDLIDFWRAVWVDFSTALVSWSKIRESASEIIERQFKDASV
jgi:hypothetical protein